MGCQGALMLSFGESQPEQGIDRLNQLLGATRLEVDFAAASADRCLEPRKPHSNAFLFELLSDDLGTSQAAAFRTPRSPISLPPAPARRGIIADFASSSPVGHLLRA
jgi:hypothetical protein